MAKKKKTYSPQLACDISVDENGQGTFNTFPILAELRLIFSQVFEPSQEQIIGLVNERIEALRKELGEARAHMKRPSRVEARAELLKEREADIQKCYYHALNLLREDIGPIMDEVLRDLVNEVAKRTLEELAPQIETNIQGGLKCRAKEVIKSNQAHKRRLLGLSDPTRPKGTGSFRNEQEFLLALEDVLTRKGKLSQPQALYYLSRHTLYQGKPLNLKECQKNAKSLRNWLTRSALTWKQAIEIYSAKSDK